MNQNIKTNAEKRAADAALSFFPPRAINQEGIDLIKRFEGLRLSPYRCPTGLWTIGWGHTRTVHPGMRLNEAGAEKLLDEDLTLAEKAVSRLVSVPLNDNQYATLVAFVFNVGVGNFEKSSLLRLLNRGWYEQVPAQLARWNRASGEVLGGLARRRAAEARLWNTPDGSVFTMGPLTDQQVRG